MHILLIGSGGREHSLAWKLAQSPKLMRLTCAPGNPGMAALGQNVDIPTDEIPSWAKTEKVDLVVVGPEAPLAEGLADALEEVGIPCFGPKAAGARIETSKNFVKELCTAYNIPTARHGTFTDEADAIAFLDSFTAPYVIKADGLAAGKGVIIAQTRKEAETAIRDMLSGQFGDAGKTLLIEEFLMGTEISVFALCDGTRLVPFGAAQDHKRAFDGNEGPNTGGMGGFSPSPVDTHDTLVRVYTEILAPTLRALREQNIDYRGVFFAGLMVTDDGPKLIEYNCRFGDPECQMLMRRLETDLVEPLYAAAKGDLSGITAEWSDDCAANIVYATKGYPGSYEKGSAIQNLEAAAQSEGAVIFHAGTRAVGDEIIAHGGRVLNVTATGATLGEALDRAYAAADKIDWTEGFYRTDIGRDFRG